MGPAAQVRLPLRGERDGSSQSQRAVKGQKREREDYFDRLALTFDLDLFFLSLSLNSPRSSFAARGKLSVPRVWSRSEASSTALADALIPRPVSTFGGGEEGEEGGGGALDKILTSDDVDAVLLVLPVQAMPSVARRALRAGKAVLQEKPVAGTVAEALETLAVAREAAAAAKEKGGGGGGKNPLLPVFALAENYRSEPGVLAAAAAASELSPPSASSGVTTISLVGNMPMDRSNRYHGSRWRRDAAGCPGCFLMDSSVHFVAALRSVGGAAGLGEPSRVGARATSRCGAGNDLPAPDTLAAWIEYGAGGGEQEDGHGAGGATSTTRPTTSTSTTTGTVSVTFAGAAPRFALTLDTRAGAVELSRGGYGGTASGRGAGYTVAVSRSPAAAGEGSDTTFHPFGGLEAELEALLRLSRGRGTAADAAALSPASAARDLALVEAMLRSSAGGGAPTAVEEIARGVDPLESSGFGVAV